MTVEALSLVFMMIAPSASDIHVQNHSFAVSEYQSLVECTQALTWINEHQANLSRHLWCEDVSND